MITVESLKFVGPMFVVCQFFTGSLGRNFLDWLVGVKGERGGVKDKITPRKFHGYLKAVP